MHDSATAKQQSATAVDIEYFYAIIKKMLRSFSFIVFCQ